jgi:polyhydroxyalkanoate synthesis regulator phasin
MPLAQHGLQWIQSPVPLAHPALSLMMMEAGKAPVTPGQVVFGRDPARSGAARKGYPMQLTDVLQFVEATLDKLSAARAQELARQIAAGDGREQATKVAQDLLDWSQRNRDRMREIVRREVTAKLSTIGVASTKDVDALKRRVRELERATGLTKSGAKKKTTAKRTAAKKTTKASTQTRPAATGASADAGPTPRS